MKRITILSIIFLSLFTFLILPTPTHAATSIKTLYSWVKDVAGNVSNSLSDTVDMNLPTEGTIYYVSQSGLDTNNGTSSSTPWKTIFKVNTQTYQPGDSILFKKGDKWTNETITVNSSGNSTSRITYGAYGSGNNPIISGFTTLSGWTAVSGYPGVYEASCGSCSSSLNMVTVNNVNTPIGRYPNANTTNGGYLTFESFNSALRTINDIQLTGTPNWNGAGITVRSNQWTVGRGIITDHSGSTITYSGVQETPMGNGYGYFIQNDIKTLDQQGEWYFNVSTKKLQMYFSGTPSSYSVKASTLNYILTATSKSYVTITDIYFEGSNIATIFINGGSQQVYIQNCEVYFSGLDGIVLSGSTNGKIEYTNINNTNSDGIKSASNNVLIKNNNISNIGLLPGMGNEEDGYTGIEIQGGVNVTMEFNNLYNIGGMGMFPRGNNYLVKNNLVENFCLTIDDCGGIYTSGVADNNRRIIGNIILNGWGNKNGTPGTGSSTQGIYLDSRSTGIIVTGNTVANCGLAGLRFHNSYNIPASNNTFYNNTNNILIIKSFADEGTFVRGLTLENNITVARTASQRNISLYSYLNDNMINVFGTSNNNYYARPIDDNLMIQNRVANTTISYNLANWQVVTGQDLNSHKSPITITDVNDLRFEYNATTLNKTVSLGSNNYMDVTGAIYTGDISLLPYTSIVLIKSN